MAAVAHENPFGEAAAARSLAWKGFVRRRSDEVAHALVVARKAKVAGSYKRFVLDQLGRTCGEAVFLPCWRSSCR